CRLLEFFAPVAEAVSLAHRLPGRVHASMGADDACLGLVVKAEQVIAHGNFSCSPPLPHDRKKTGFPRPATPFLAPFGPCPGPHRPKQRSVTESRPYGVGQWPGLMGKCRARVGPAVRWR